ncbi:AraC family transcriptional regulator [Gracilibacillus marinus]|uniref:AraC family transcriptional regulator n=1 Tax=Gracilibacillus marinus TaxID=630535 RepID=A0ABV8VTU3_9BACI
MSTNTTKATALHPKVTAYYFKEWTNFHMDFHTHDSIEIMYVISGECTVEVVDERLLMKKNQFVLINRKVPHRLIVGEKPCRMLNLEFKLTNMHRKFPSLFELAEESRDLHELLTHAYTFHFLKDTNGVFHSLRTLVLELDTSLNNDKDNYLMVHILITQVLLLIARNIDEAKNQSQQESSMYVKKVVEYIHENYDYDIKVEQLSALTHLHANYLHRIFKETMGCTIVEYLTKVRIEKAKLFITQTDIPITDIASFIGMNSSQYFSKVFKKETGSTPTDYRKNALSYIQSGE